MTEFKAILRDSGSETYEITIPKRLCKEKGLKSGTQYSFSIDADL